MAERWLEREVARGLQGLLALRLDGAPAQDAVTRTLDVWLVALESMPVAWDMQLDTGRIRDAFRALYRTTRRWPAPAAFMEQLGNRDPPPALPAPKTDPAVSTEWIARLREIRKSIPPYSYPKKA